MRLKNTKDFKSGFSSGLSLIEVLLVIAILAFLVFLTLPLSVDFYKNQQLNTVADEIVQALRRAQNKAVSGESDKKFGVYITTGEYVLFQTDSNYIGRDQSFDEKFKVVDLINFSSINEVVFSKLTGLPSVSGKIILTNDTDSLAIDINRGGAVSLTSQLAETIVLWPNANNFTGLGVYPSGRYSFNFEYVRDQLNPDITRVTIGPGPASGMDLYGLEDPNPSLSGTITKVTVFFKGAYWSDGSGPWQGQTIMWLSGFKFGPMNNLTYTDIAENTTWFSDSYTARPNGQPWTWTSVKNMLVGVGFNIATRYAWANQVKVEVEYIPGN